MRRIIEDMPWVTDDAGEEIRLPNGYPLVCPTTNRALRIWHDQILVWVSLAPVGLSSLPPGYPLFPVVVDIGFNDSFLMQAHRHGVG